jgi:hypothetical protein
MFGFVLASDRSDAFKSIWRSFLKIKAEIIAGIPQFGKTGSLPFLITTKSDGYVNDPSACFSH